MKPNFIKTRILFLGALLTASSHAAIVLSDTFDSGVGDWRRAGDTGTLANDSGQLSWIQGGDQNRQTIGRSFTPTAVATGETIRLSFNYTHSSASVSILRIGIYNLQNTITADGWSSGDSNIGGSFAGFTTFVRDASATGNNARFETGTIDTTTTRGPLYAGTDIGSLNTTNYDINQSGTVTYSVVFEVTRNSATSVSTLFTMASSGGTHYSIGATTTNATANAIDNFDMIGMRSGGGTMLIDNVVVEIIPEPSALLLSGFGLSALMLRRTRKI